MDVVNFSEGILGIDKNAAPIVAKCLRKVGTPDWVTALKINTVVHTLERGDRVNIEILRQIGELSLAKAQKLFLDAS